VADAARCQHGELGSLLRREGLTYTQLSNWRNAQAAGTLTDNVIPWIAPEDQVDDWATFVPEDFVCLNSYGPNFQVGDRFIVPVGDGPTRLWVNPNREPRGDLVEEGVEGMILEGPVCARGNGGILVSWLVLTDTGLSGWASEGYISSSVPWISPIVESSND